MAPLDADILNQKPMEENKKYELIEDHATGMVSESLGTYTPQVSTLDALWALVLDQAEDVQRSLEQRLRHLLAHKNELSTPYTTEELHQRITLSEEQFSQGQCFSHAEVQDEVNKLFESWS